MKDSEYLPTPAAAFVLAQTQLLLRHLHNGNLTEVWHGLSRLDMAAYKAHHIEQERQPNPAQLRLFP